MVLMVMYRVNAISVGTKTDVPMAIGVLILMMIQVLIQVIA